MGKNVLGWKNRVWRWVVMIHRELAAYHNYTPRMVLFRGVDFIRLQNRANEYHT